MSDETPHIDVESLVARISEVMGRVPLKITRPGGPSRPVYRAYFDDTSVIVSAREDDGLVQKERMILHRIGKTCPSVPRLLAYEHGLMFTSDGGVQRLPVHLHSLAKQERLPILLKAMAALSQVQNAANEVDWSGVLDGIGTNRDWIRHFVRGPQRMGKLLRLTTPDYDVDALCQRLEIKEPKFVKWDARAANAAIGDTGEVTWFDYEHSGLRHGIEDYAWLIADETLPLRLPDCYDAIADQIESNMAGALGLFDIFTCLQASFRLRVILSEVEKKSWTARKDILAQDWVGADPHMAENLARNGAFLAGRHNLTLPLVDLFEHTADRFRATYA